MLTDQQALHAAMFITASWALSGPERTFDIDHLEQAIIRTLARMELAGIKPPDPVACLTVESTALGKRIVDWHKITYQMQANNLAGPGRD
jgi:hypothetical protein